jgi:hypothetical protein
MRVGSWGVFLVIVTGLVSLVLANRDAVAWLLRQLEPDRDEDDDVRGAARFAEEGGSTRADLYKEAQRLHVRGRSRMSRSELEAAVEKLETAWSPATSK